MLLAIMLQACDQVLGKDPLYSLTSYILSFFVYFKKDNNDRRQNFVQEYYNVYFRFFEVLPDLAGFYHYLYSVGQLLAKNKL